VPARIQLTSRLIGSEVLMSMPLLRAYGVNWICGVLKVEILRAIFHDRNALVGWKVKIPHDSPLFSQLNVPDINVFLNHRPTQSDFE
jgi:hypothetical protein